MLKLWPGQLQLLRHRARHRVGGEQSTFLCSDMPTISSKNQSHREEGGETDIGPSTRLTWQIIVTNSATALDEARRRDPAAECPPALHWKIRAQFRRLQSSEC